MTKPEDLIKYMLLQYLGSLDFISSRLSRVKSRSDLYSIGEFIIPESILRFGFKTKLKYADISSLVWEKVSVNDIFTISEDSLFGEKVTFDIDKYRVCVDELRSESNSYKLIQTLIENFGQEGFDHALSLVAASHKWERIEAKAGFIEILDEIEPKSIKSLSHAEIEEIISEISKIRVYVDDSVLPQADKVQAALLAAAAATLAQTPNPPWSIIKEVLILIAAISTTLAFVIPIAAKIH